MDSSDDKIISIDVSSNKVKVALISYKLEIESISMQYYDVIDEDVNGFAKKIDMKQLWNKIRVCIKNVIETKKKKSLNIIGISSCAQRMAFVFLDKNGNEIYGGPNIDIRGIDSAYLIEDEFTDEEIFNITGHGPNILFCLARLLWYKEEEEERYNEIKKVLMLDDWLGYKLTNEMISDFTSVPESQIFDINKMQWSSKIIEAFDFDPDFFPELVYPGNIIGYLKPDLKSWFGLNNSNIPIIKGGGDTHMTLLGMGAIKEGDIGISLGTTAPVDIITSKPIIDPEHNLWTTCHPIKGKWILEANTGNTGNCYDWFKQAFFRDSTNGINDLIEIYVKKISPGARSTYAYLGPEKMSIKDQTSIKRGVFVFEPPSMVSEELPKIEHFARSTFENICFGILENYRLLLDFAESDIRLFCGGGMANSNEFIKILANVLNKDISVPKYKDSAFIGTSMNVLLGLKLYKNYEIMIEKLIESKKFNVDPSISKQYDSIYRDWKNLKSKIDEL
ncbi:MAG: FGGY family carbohydrate kinase [Promethearchaeota archaeon]